MGEGDRVLARERAVHVDHQQKLDAAGRQIDALKVTVAGLQKTLADLLAAQAKLSDDLKKKQDTPPAKDTK